LEYNVALQKGQRRSGVRRKENLVRLPIKIITILEHSKGICPRNCPKDELMDPEGKSSWTCGKDLEEEMRSDLVLLIASVRFSDT
jgi:hypothetical protein